MGDEDDYFEQLDPSSALSEPSKDTALPHATSLDVQGNSVMPATGASTPKDLSAKGKGREFNLGVQSGEYWKDEHLFLLFDVILDYCKSLATWRDLKWDDVAKLFNDLDTGREYDSGNACQIQFNRKMRRYTKYFKTTETGRRTAAKTDENNKEIPKYVELLAEINFLREGLKKAQRKPKENPGIAAALKEIAGEYDEEPAQLAVLGKKQKRKRKQANKKASSTSTPSSSFIEETVALRKEQMELERLKNAKNAELEQQRINLRERELAIEERKLKLQEEQALHERERQVAQEKFEQEKRMLELQQQQQLMKMLL